MNLYYESIPFRQNKSTSLLTQSLHDLIDTRFAHFSSLTFSLLAFKNFWEVELWQSCSWIHQTDTYLTKAAFSKHLNKIEIWQSKLLLPSSHSRWCLQVIRCYWKWFKVVFLSFIIFYVCSIILNWGLHNKQRKSWSTKGHVNDSKYWMYNRMIEPTRKNRKIGTESTSFPL